MTWPQSSSESASEIIKQICSLLRFPGKTTRNQVSVLKQVNLWICLPPISEQHRLVAKLDALQAEVDALNQLQTNTATELDALLPSVLSKAFAGEL